MLLKSINRLKTFFFLARDIHFLTISFLFQTNFNPFNFQYKCDIQLAAISYLVIINSMKPDKDKPVEYEINKVHRFQPSFEENAGVLSRMFFIWTHELIRRGNEKPLDMDDLSDLKESEEPTYSATRFTDIFYSIKPKNGKRLFAAFRKYLGFTYMVASILLTISHLMLFTGPFVINKILNFLNSPNPNITQGVLYATLLVVSYFIRMLLFQHSLHYQFLSCIQVLNAGNFFVFQKILKLSSASRKYLEAGAIMNYVNVDIISFFNFIMFSTIIVSAPFMLAVAITYLVIEVGWIGILAPIIFLFGVFVQQKMFKLGFIMRKNQLFWSDKRSKCVSEYFTGIRVIKYYGWEDLVKTKIQNIRQEELAINFKVMMVRTFIEVVMNMTPIIASLAVFIAYVLIQGEEALTPAKVYTVLAIFNIISAPLRNLIMTIIDLINATASMARIDHFLEYGEKSQQGINTDNVTFEKGQIHLDKCKFDWQTQQAKDHYEKGAKLSGKKVEKEEKNKKNGKKNKSVSKDKNMLKEKLLKDQEQDEVLKGGVNPYSLSVDKLHIKKGEFIGVVGKVGSGKSTLISAILGEIDKVQGKINRRGTTSYVPQVSWLRSATIRQNILFESEYDEDRYEEILDICELKPDLEILGGGDLTEIGEKGVNLSGGQKQRISIARALYNDADIYLVDDCLSALDAYVGKNIFNNVLKKYLHENGKTIVFVTNAIDYTEFCDRVLVMENGRIAEEGNPLELKNQGGLYSELSFQTKKMKEEQQEKEREEKKKRQKEKSEIIDIDFQEQEKEKEKKKKKEKKELQALVKVEERLKGAVPWRLYYRFFTGSGGILATLMFLFTLLSQIVRVGCDWWVGQWSTDSFYLAAYTYMWIFGVISATVGILLIVKGLFFAKFINNSSRVIQRTLIKTLLHSPLSWFDVTPTGRILARTSKDQDELDSTLSTNIQQASQNLFNIIASIVLICVATPFYLVIAAITGIVYYKLVKMYMNTQRQTKRLEGITTAPLLTHIQETIAGIYVIRAFDKTQNFLDRFFLRQKYYIVTRANQIITQRWISLMTDIFSNITVAAAGYLGVLSVVAKFGANNSNLIGLSLVWSLQISTLMSFTLRILAETQSNMNAVVRLYDYIDNNPSEKDFDEPAPKNKDWPNRGHYQIDSISYKYRPELPLVIKSISFDVKENAKIGIVGRTGSGKSTMTLGLLRILQLAQNEDGTTGTIDLDGEDYSAVGLHYLRHNIAIIPQDPTLFTGTIKSNIDPFNMYEDKALVKCLKKVELWNQIRDNPDEKDPMKKKIYSPVDQGGSNFSLGQRQLICMCRALVRQPKVLIMDEATASIDEKTDETIQKMIRKEFNETTVITIAHRLNTIIFYDKILVLDNGQIQEYDTPLKLVKDPNSFLGKLIRKTGESFMKKIIALAEKGVEDKY